MDEWQGIYGWMVSLPILDYLKEEEYLLQLGCALMAGARPGPAPNPPHLRDRRFSGLNFRFLKMKGFPFPPFEKKNNKRKGTPYGHSIYKSPLRLLIECLLHF